VFWPIRHRHAVLSANQDAWELALSDPNFNTNGAIAIIAAQERVDAVAAQGGISVAVSVESSTQLVPTVAGPSILCSRGFEGRISWWLTCHPRILSLPKIIPIQYRY
jgi:hypothetical protein